MCLNSHYAPDALFCVPSSLSAAGHASRPGGDSFLLQHTASELGRSTRCNTVHGPVLGPQPRRAGRCQGGEKWISLPQGREREGRTHMRSFMCVIKFRLELLENDDKPAAICNRQTEKEMKASYPRKHRIAAEVQTLREAESMFPSQSSPCTHTGVNPHQGAPTVATPSHQAIPLLTS